MLRMSLDSLSTSTKDTAIAIYNNRCTLKFSCECGRTRYGAEKERHAKEFVIDLDEVFVTPDVLGQCPLPGTKIVEPKASPSHEVGGQTDFPKSRPKCHQCDRIHVDL